MDSKDQNLNSFRKQASAGAFLLLGGFSAAKLQEGHFSRGSNQSREKAVGSKHESKEGRPAYQMQE